MNKNNELRGIIYSKFSSLSECARALGWSKQRLNRIANGNKVPDVIETIMLSRVLGMSLNETASIFLRYMSTNA